MIEKFPEQLRKTIEEVFAAEIRLSYGEAEAYNSYVADTDYVTSISASSRTFVGAEAVKTASVNVSKGGCGERNRTFEWVSAEYEENMAYVVFKASVETKDDKDEYMSFAWVISIIFRKINGEWKIVHRQNTRWNKG